MLSSSILFLLTSGRPHSLMKFMTQAHLLFILFDADNSCSFTAPLIIIPNILFTVCDCCHALCWHSKIYIYLLALDFLKNDGRAQAGRDLERASNPTSFSVPDRTSNPTSCSKLQGTAILPKASLLQADLQPRHMNAPASTILVALQRAHLQLSASPLQGGP